MSHDDYNAGEPIRRIEGEEQVILHVLGCRQLQYGMFEDNLIAITQLCRDRGYSCWFVYPNEPVESFARDIEDAGGRVLVVPHSDEASPRGAYAINGVIRRTRPAVVHAHFGRPSYIAVAAAWAAGVPRVLATKHHESWPALSRPHALALRVIALMADRILCVSEIVYDEALAAGVSAEKLLVAPFGVNTDRFGPPSREAGEAIRRELGIEPGACVVLSASHLREPKGIDVLVDAWHQLSISPSTAVLLVAGDGPLRERLEQQAASGGSAASIKFLGIRQDMPQLMAGCDVLVCPSLSEAGGLVVMEALGVGIPTVSTLVGLVRTLPDEGLYLPARPTGDADALATALSKAISDPEARAEMGRRARVFVTDMMSLDASARRLAAVYEPAGLLAAPQEVSAEASRDAMEAAALSEAAAEGVREHVRDQTAGVLSRSVVMLGSKVVIWALAFVMTVMLPRYLGAAAFGRLYFAISFTTFFSILVEFGLNALVTREVSRKPEDATRYLLNAAMLKAGLWVIAFAVMTVVIRLVDYPAETRAAVLILAGGVLIQSMSSLLVAVLQANDRARWVAVSSITGKAVYLGLGVTALLLGYGVIAVALVILVGALSELILDSFWFMRLRRRVDVHAGWRGIEIGSLLRRALPFFSALLFGALYFRVDVIILSILGTDAEVGHYGAAYRLFETTYFIPEAFLFALFPVICRMALRGDNALAMVAQKALDLMLFLAFPIAIGAFLLAEPIITTLYGPTQYLSSVPILKVLAFGVVLMYANGVFTNLLVATERQRKLAVTAGVAAATNIALNLALIPLLGALGAALSTVLTEVLVLGMNFSFLPRELTTRLRPSSPLKAVLASAIMAVPLVLLHDINLFLLIAIGIVTYFAAAIVLKALPSEDWRLMRTALLRLRTT